jgi:GNAT superfamily N-acetyltransferase
MNAREADAFETQMTAADTEPRVTAPDNPIRTAMLAQLKNAGVPLQTADAYAGLYEAALTTIADRAGVDPTALYERYGLQVERPELGQPPKAQEAAPEAPGATTAETVPVTGEGLPIATGPASGLPAGQAERRTENVGPPTGQAERRAGLNKEALDRPIDVMANVGAAALQMRAEGIKPGTKGARAVFLAHGPDGPLYNIIGGPKDKSTVSAAALKTEGIPVPPTPADTGERLSGAQIRERLLAARAAATETEAPAAPVLEATPVDTTAVNPETGAPDAATGSEESGYADRLRRARERGVPASYPRERESHKQREQRRAAHYDAAFADLLDAARALDPAVDPTDLRAEFDTRVQELESRLAEQAESGHDPTNLLRSIARYGGLNTVDATFPGELRYLQDGSTFGRIAGVSKVFQKTGVSLDDMLTQLQQDQRFQWIENPSMLIDAIDDAVRHGAQTDFFPGNGELWTDAQMDPTQAWWKDSWRPVNLLREELSETLDTGEGDTSFNAAEFDQSLFDDLTPPDATAEQLTESGAKTDKLDTGEVQPRLPGDVGEVRETEKATPTFDAPFTLTGEIRKATAAQKTLFQTETLTPELVKAWALDVKQRAGTDLRDFDVYLTREGDLHLDTIAVERGAQRAGLGGKVMNELTRFADAHGRRITLQLANKGYLTGTTSRSRLVTFYKRFGFVENKGRYKDFALSLYAHMYREPTLPAREGLRNDRAANLKAWFGQSAVVDDEGQPLVVYHGTTASFDTFETERGNIESDFGRGIYFSNNPRDVGANYAGIGPDLESKIQRRAEQLAQERDVKYDDPTARADAEAEFVTHGGLTMPVYLKLENPAILGGAGESRLEMEHPRDEEGDFVGEPTGTLIDFVQAIQALDQHEDAQHALQKILEVSDYESITVRNAVDILKRDDRFSTSTDDETGDMNAHEIIRQALEKVGFDGVIDRSVDTKFGSQKKIGKPMEGMDAETVHYIAFRPDQIKSAIGNAGTFNPHEPNILRQDRRGAIRFGPDRQFTIALLEKADLSTFLHESGHFFLEVFGDVVDQARAIEETARTPQQQQLLADYQTLLAHLGVESREGIERAQHEQFAQSFEAYLFEGQAPSLELAPLFARFRAWLVGVYRSLRNLHVELTPEVRRVMDRLLASDRAIDDAEARRGVRPMFATAADAGMDASEFAVYTKTITEASQTARAQLDRKLLSEIRREQKAAWTAQQAEIRQTVTEETQQQPVYRALAAIQKGEHPNGQPLIEGLETRPLKLSRAILVDRYGEERLKRLPRNPYLYAVDGGLDPEVLAKMFGFTSGDAMLTALEQAPPMDAVIGAEAKRRMLTAHGSLLLDGTLPEAAQAAVANTERELVLRAELRALARKRRELDPFLKHERATKQSALDDAEKERAYERRWFEAEHKLALAIAVGRKQSEVDGLEREVKDLRAKARGGAAYIRAAVPPTSVLKDIAATRLSGLTIREIDPQRFWSASRRAGLQALERAARQDLDGAIVAKQQELVNLHMFRAAEDIVADVQERTEDALDLTSKTRRATIGEAGQNYLDQIDGLLDRFGFAQASPQVLDRRPELRKFVAGIEATGQAVDLPEELFDESRRRNYKDLTVDEFIGVSDGLKAIVHLALMKNRLLRAQERAELDAAATTIADSIREHTTRRREPPARDRRASAERGRTIDDVFASHRKMSSLARELDGFEDGGAFWSGIIRPLNDAGAREATMNAEAAHKFSDLVEAAYPRGEKRDLYQKLEVPAVGESLSKMERIMIALNWGNEGNRDRIRRSEHWSDEQVHAVLATLDERDATFVQGVFDLIDGYWAEIKAKQERVYGIAPEKVEAVPFKLGARELAGGYFPLRYDERLSAKVGGQLDLETSALARQSAYVQATTKRGHTKERLTSVQLPVRRDFGVMFEHVKTVIHDLTHHEALIDVTRLLGHQAVQSAIYETHGDIIYRQFKNGIRDVAFGDIPATNAFERSLNHLRSGATIAGLGWSLSTALLQPIGLTQSMARIGPKWVGVGLSRWLRGSVQMEHTASWINEKSAMMRTRTITQQREINEIRNTLGVGTGKFSGLVDDVLGKLTFDTVTKQGIADSYFYLITQMQRIADIPTWLGQYEKSMAAGESEDRAIAIADQAVLDAQGGGQNKDLASVQRGGPLLKLWTNFYSFFNVTYNLTAEATHRATKTDPASLGRLGVDYLLLYSIPASLGYLLREGMRGNVDPDNPDQTWIGLLRENLSYMMGTVLGLRELAGVVQGYYGYEGPAGARAFSAAGKLVQQSIQAAKKISEGDAADAFDEAFWKSLNATGGILFHYPASQLQRTVQGVAAISEGKTQNPGVLVGGVPKEQKK